MKKQLLKFSNEYFFAHYEVTFSNVGELKELHEKIESELEFQGQEEYEASRYVRRGEDYDDLLEEYTYELDVVEELDLGDDLEVDYKFIGGGGNG